MTALPTNSPTPAMFGGGGSWWQAPLYMLGGGLIAASQPGGNFGAGTQQAGRDWRTMQMERERMGWLRDQAAREQQQWEADQRRANQEAEQRAAVGRQIAALFGGSQPGAVNTASGPQPGQPAMFNPVQPVGNYGAAVGGAPRPAMLGGSEAPQSGALPSPAGGDLPFGFNQDQAALFMALPIEQQIEILTERGFAQPEWERPIEIAGKLVDPRTMQVLGDFSEAEIALAQAKRPLTNINMPGNPTPDDIGRKAFAEENAKSQAKYFDSVASAGAQAQTRLGDIDQLINLIELTPQGAGQEYLNRGAAVLSRFGVDLGEYTNVPAAQAFQSIVSRIAPTLRVSGSGATSDFEMQQFLRSLPAIGNMPGGNRIIANNLKKITERSVAEANIAIKVQGGEMTPAEGRKAILDLGALNLDLPSLSSAPPAGGPGGAPGGAGTGARIIRYGPDGSRLP
jgi:hypothetical protein